MDRVVIWVGGRVQGVGFRWWVSRQAGRLGLAGLVENLPDGRVGVDAQGLPDDVAALVDAVTGPRVGGRPGHVSEWLVERRPPLPDVVGFDAR